MKKAVMGEYVAEMIGTLVLLLVGDGVVATSVLYHAFDGGYWGICVVWGLGVTIAIYLVGAISGAHLNPAVTVGFALYGGFPWKKVPGYIASQIVGAFLGAGLVYALFYPAINLYNQAHQTARSAAGGLVTSGIFFTHPSKGITPGHAFTDEIILTAVLVIGILAIVDRYNTNRPMGNMAPLMIGLLLAMVAAFGGMLESWAINPARDLGPRLFGWLFGWGQNAFPGPDAYWWIPIVAPMLGAVAAGLVYNYMLRPFMPANPKNKAYGPSADPKSLEDRAS